MRISATASMMPEPQIPVMPVAAVSLAKSGSSDHTSEPMTRKRGSFVAGSISMRSIAPGAARWPLEICAPSKAGPVGDEQASTFSLLPSRISALVPTSTTKVNSSDWSGASESATAAASAPTWPAMQGKMKTRADRCIAVRSRSDAGNSSASEVANAKGACPSSTGSMPRSRWCITGLQTNTVSTMCFGSMSPWVARVSVNSLIAARTAFVISTSPPGFIIT